MLHPSYTDLMNEVNKGVEQGEHPVVNSRYSIVLAAAVKQAPDILWSGLPFIKRSMRKRMIINAGE